MFHMYTYTCTYIYTFLKWAWYFYVHGSSGGNGRKKAFVIVNTSECIVLVGSWGGWAYIYIYKRIYKDNMLILESNSCIKKQCLQLQALGLAQQPPPRDCEGEGHRGSEGRVVTWEKNNMGARHLCFNLGSNHLRMVSWNLRPMHFVSVFKVAQDLKPGGYKHFFYYMGRWSTLSTVVFFQLGWNYHCRWSVGCRTHSTVLKDLLQPCHAYVKGSS